jgi:alpha-L-arabinofuranosidase
MTDAHVVVDPRFPVGRLDRRLFGAFVEHLGRCVYDGLYEPGHPAADADGFRTDVMDLVRELGVSNIRYPGGNFVSGYRWEDGVGPRDRRPRRLDLAWHSTETNQVGVDEFATWAARVGAEVVLAVNLGTRGVTEALDLLEYTNIRSGTAWSDARVANGRVEPYGVRMWCLGNEMDGPWQLGHRSAADYGQLAAQVARAMRQLDPDVELVACGSSSAYMPTFGAWERTVLEHTFDDVDLISCHAYYELRDGDLGGFLASGVAMDRFIDAVVATADHVAALKRSPKRIDIAFDEWNVWYSQRFEAVEKITGIDNWPVAPRLLEDNYTVADAVVVGSLLITLLRHADRVRTANLAQLVNVIAPIMTEPGGPAWRQTIFHPFATTSRLARGTVLDVRVTCDTYPTAAHGDVPLLDAVATHDAASGRTAIFLVHRGQDGPTTVTVDVAGLGVTDVEESRTLADPDLEARNTLHEPDRVVLTANATARLRDAKLTVDLPPVSWTAISLR